jgi:hypothetical protein
MVGFISMKDLKSWKRLSCLITAIGSIQWIIITLIATQFYPGGYDFINQYFSDLGSTVSINSSPNTISRFLFVLTFIIGAIALIPFWIAIATLFTKNIFINVLSRVGSVLGLASTPLLIALAIYPKDTQEFAHSIFASIALLLFAIAIIVYSVAILLNPDYHKIYAAIGIVISIVIVLYGFFGFFSEIDVIMQKIVVYSFFVWVFIQVTKIWKDVES